MAAICKRSWKKGSQKITPPSKELIQALLEQASSEFRPMLLLAVSTGVRAGEMWGLRWRHVDLVKRELRVEMRIDASHNEDDQGTKTSAIPSFFRQSRRFD